MKSEMREPVEPFHYKLDSILSPFHVIIHKLELTYESKLLDYSEEDLLEEWPKLKIPSDVKPETCIHAYMELEIEGLLFEIEARYIIDNQGVAVTKNFKILTTTLPAKQSWTDTIKDFIEKWGAFAVAIIRALIASFI